jgi:peptidoglycan/LPS O-acetylase OafA/YrhL
MPEPVDVAAAGAAPAAPPVADPVVGGAGPVEDRIAPGAARVALVAAAVVAWVAFRAGALPGGQVGVDVLLAVAGSWWASTLSAAPGPGSVRRAAGAAWHRAWPGLLAAVVLAVCWVLAAGPTRRDALTRGQALATFGGYANWHQLVHGPSEARVPPLTTPLQGMWAWSVVAQVALAWAVLFALSRRRATRAPEGGTDPMVRIGLVLAMGLVLVTLSSVVRGVGAERLSLGTEARALPFVLGAVWASLPTGARARATGVARAAWPASVGVLVLGAAVAGPGSSVVAGGYLVLVAFAAAVLLAATATSAPDAASTGTSAVPALLAHLGAVAPVAGLALLAIHPAVLAIAAPPRTGLPWVAATVVGVVMSVAGAWAVSSLAGSVPDSPESLEARRVLLPALAFVVVVVLFIVTGAFHWAGPVDVSGT